MLRNISLKCGHNAPCSFRILSLICTIEAGMEQFENDLYRYIDLS